MADLRGDLAHTAARPIQIGDANTLILGQIPRRGLPLPDVDHRRIVPLFAVGAGDHPAVSPTFPGFTVYPDDPARLRVIDALSDQPSELLTLLRLRRRTRPTPASHRNPRIPPVLRRSLESAIRTLPRSSHQAKAAFYRSRSSSPYKKAVSSNTSSATRRLSNPKTTRCAIAPLPPSSRAVPMSISGSQRTWPAGWQPALCRSGTWSGGCFCTPRIVRGAV